jgi:hypothetical protein
MGLFLPKGPILFGFSNVDTVEFHGIDARPLKEEILHALLSSCRAGFLRGLDCGRAGHRALELPGKNRTVRMGEVGPGV